MLLVAPEVRAGGGGGGGVRPCVFMCVCVCARARLVHATRGLHSNASHTHVSLPQASLEEVQAAINRAATTVLQCAKRLWDWGEGGKPAASPSATGFLRIARHRDRARRAAAAPQTMHVEARARLEAL